MAKVRDRVQKNDRQQQQKKWAAVRLAQVECEICLCDVDNQVLMRHRQKSLEWMVAKGVETLRFDVLLKMKT